MEKTKNILVLGAGKSSIYLLDYLRDNAVSENWKITIADLSTRHLQASFAACELIDISISDESAKLEHLIETTDLVISMVPATMHPMIAKVCLQCTKNLITPSYVSDELREMDEEVKAKGLIFLNEMGVDPGIDHMSAMQIIDQIKTKGGDIKRFESYCGGLIAPVSDTNPWHYKFTWNPRNVVLAGQGVAKFLQGGEHKYIPYHQIFERTDAFEIEDYGQFEGYANRDSLKYIEAYGLNGIETMYRGTFRRPPFCKAWQVFVLLGMTDDSYVIDDSSKLSNRDFLNLFLPSTEATMIENFITATGYDQESEVFKMMDWLGLFDEKKSYQIHNGTPAKILQAMLEDKLALHDSDIDMLVMLHQFVYAFDQKLYAIRSSMVVEGEDKTHTAMAKTVGLPIAIAAKLILNGTIQNKGVVIPVSSAIYTPILAELKELGIQFKEVESLLS